VSQLRVVRSSQAAELPPGSIGGKAANLVRLDQAGLTVPAWFCITASVFEEVTAAAIASVAADLARFDPADQQQAERISRHIGEMIRAAPLADADRAALRACFRELAVEHAFVAVRSSAGDEDSASASFAGQMDSYLFVPERDLESRVLDCFASCFSPRALAYRARHHLPPAREAGVIIQRMIASRVSGVMFTANPTSGDTSETVVCAAMGVGEGVVGDRAEADTFYVDSVSWSIRRRVEVLKRSRVTLNAAAGGGTAVVDVAAADAARSALSDDQVTALAKLGRCIQQRFGGPQDVEWAIDAAGVLHVLQTRPITTLATGRTLVFDNANIVESYPGWSLPLTFSFVRAAYERTFREASRTLGVSDAVLKANQAVHANLVALINGSIYYNLLNWYKLFLFVPGFAGALPAWEQALGVRGLTPPRDPPPTTISGRVHARWLQLRVASRLIWHFVRLDRSVREFHQLFAGLLDDFNRHPLDRADAHEVLELSERLIVGFAEPYAISCVNDAFVQQTYALVGRLIARWELGDASLRNDLLAGEGVMQSILPVQSLMALAREVQGDPGLASLFETTPSAIIWDRLSREQDFAAFRARLQRHIDEYGDRTFHELKLETPSAADQPELVIELLRNYAAGSVDTASPDRPRASSPSRSEDRRKAAEAAVRRALAGHPLRRAIFSFVLRRCRRMVAHREDLRLARSRGFGLMKRLVRALGQRLAQSGLIDDRRDVFYLGIEEITAAFRGASLTRDLRVLVTQRRAEYETFKEQPLPSRVTTRGIALSNVTSATAAAASGASETLELRGIGCSAGRVRGRARVVLQPEQHLHIRGEILVAPMTDPGWVFLMVPASGLIVERGSVLSHTAIIGRELGIPTVVAVPEATSRITDGQLIELDGAAGIIRLLD
jgi:phosphohistidine swiveling domain-containing protein